MNEENKTAIEEHVDELIQFKDSYYVYGKYALAALFVAAGVVIAVGAYRANVRKNTLKASQLLFSNQTVADLNTIIEKHSSTPAAPLALLKLAKMHFDYDNYEMSKSKYNEFIKLHPESPFLQAAELGGVHCIEAMAQYDAALAGFEKFVSANPSHYLTPQALLGQGRCMNAVGRKDEATQLLQKFIDENPDSGWVFLAESTIEDFDSYQPEEIAVSDTPLMPDVGNFDFSLPAGSGK